MFEVLVLYLILGGLIALGSWGIYLGRRSQRPSLVNWSLSGLSLVVPLFLITASFELAFWFEHGKPYAQVNRYKELYDCSGKDLDLTLQQFEDAGDFVLLDKAVLDQAEQTASPNLIKRPDSKGIRLASKDGEPAYLDLKITTHVPVEHRFYQVFLSTATLSQGGIPYLSTFDSIKGELFFHNDRPRVGNEWVLSAFQYSNEAPAGAIFKTPSQTFHFRLWVKGKGEVLFKGPALSLARSYPVTQYEFGGAGFTQEALLKRRRSANHFYIEPINRALQQDNPVRILALGGSTTYGDGAGDVTNYPIALKNLLNLHSPGPRFEVINAGQKGNTSFGMLYQYDQTDRFHLVANGDMSLKSPMNCTEFTLKDLKPDVVLLAPVYNDLFTTLQMGNQILAANEKEGVVYFLNTVVPRFLKNNYFMKNNAVGDFLYKRYRILVGSWLTTQSAESDRNAQQVFASNLELLVSKFQAQGAKVILLQFPYQPNKKGTLERIYRLDHEVIGGVAKKMGVPFLDIAEVSSVHHWSDMYWYDYIHPLDVGYMDYATQIYNHLGPQILSVEP